MGDCPGLLYSCVSARRPSMDVMSNPYGEPAAGQAVVKCSTKEKFMDKVEVNWNVTLQVWWSYIWRCTVFAMILGLVLGFIGGIVVALIGKPELGAAVGGVLGHLVSITVSIYVMKVILNKKFKTFTIALIKNDNT